MSSKKTTFTFWSSTKKCEQSKATLIRLIHKNSKSKMRNYNPDYKNHSERYYTINAIFKIICQKSNFSSKTLFFAIGILDSVSSLYLFDKKNYFWLGLVSLSLASKIQENRLFSNIKYLLKFYPKMKYNNIIKLEKNVLKALDFNLNLVTSFDFLSEIFTQNEIFDEIKTKEKELYYKCALKLNYYCNLEYKINRFTSLVVALCIVMSARNIFDCEILLPEFLQKITSYSEEDLEPCYVQIQELLLKII